MKKNIAALVVFLFILQVNTPSFAQFNPEVEKQALMKCYDQLFAKTSKNIPLTADQRLERLKFLTLGLANKIEKNENDDSTKTNLAGLALLGVSAGGSVVAITRYYAGRPYIKEYNKILKETEVELMDAKETFNNEYNPYFHYLKDEIEHRAGNTRSLAKRWILLSVVLLAVTIYLYETQEKFSEDFAPVSFLSLLNASSVANFESQLFRSNNPSSVEIGNRLLKSCQATLKEDVNEVQKSIEGITDQEINETMEWIEQK